MNSINVFFDCYSKELQLYPTASILQGDNSELSLKYSLAYDGKFREVLSVPCNSMSFRQVLSRLKEMDGAYFRINDFSHLLNINIRSLDCRHIYTNDKQFIANVCSRLSSISYLLRPIPIKSIPRATDITLRMNDSYISLICNGSLDETFAPKFLKAKAVIFSRYSKRQRRVFPAVVYSFPKSSVSTETSSSTFVAFLSSACHCNGVWMDEKLFKLLYSDKLIAEAILCSVKHRGKQVCIPPIYLNFSCCSIIPENRKREDSWGEIAYYRKLNQLLNSIESELNQ